MDLKSYLNWELEVLSRAVAFANLSSASKNIGMSQPQLSRIVKTLEMETGLSLLDRDSKRHSQWTQQALALASVYSKTFESFLQELAGMKGRSMSVLRLGALEGFMELALKACERALAFEGLTKVELVIEDIGPLEQMFLRGELDLLMTFREPLNAKLKYVAQLGTQSLELIQSQGPHAALEVMSPFEFMVAHSKSKSRDQKIFVSNSLQARKQWLTQMGGKGHLPSAVLNRKPTKKSETPVLLLGNNRVPELIWKKLAQ